MILVRKRKRLSEFLNFYIISHWENEILIKPTDHGNYALSPYEILFKQVITYCIFMDVTRKYRITSFTNLITAKIVIDISRSVIVESQG